jgi:hypothetical protein
MFSVNLSEGPKRRTKERGEWMGADKNSIQEFGLWTQFHLCTSTSFFCRVHAATKVLLDLGARPNQQPQDTRSGNTHDTTAGSPHRSGRFLKPVRPLLFDLASHRQEKPVRPVWQTGQAGSVQKLPKTLLRENLPQEPLLLWTRTAIARPGTSLLKNSSRQPTGRNRSDRFGKPVRPVLAWTVGKNTARGKNSKLQEIYLPIRPQIKVRLMG